MIPEALSLLLTIAGPQDRKVLLIETGPPITVTPGNPFRSASCIPLGASYHIAKAWTFIGSDRGNILEADIQLSSRSLDYFLQRSEHRETPSSYDAWKSEPADWIGDELCVQASVTATSDKPVRVQFQVRLDTHRVENRISANK